MAVILFNTEKRMINKIAFAGPEINAIYSVGKAFSLVYDEEQSKKGIISIKTADYEKTTTEKSIFIILLDWKVRYYQILLRIRSICVICLTRMRSDDT